MIHFGTAGNAARFYDEGHTASEQAPSWLAAQGLDAYEYSAGHGVSMGEATARRIGAAAKQAGVAVSLHAPYYINLCTPEPDKGENSLRHLMLGAQALDWLGGERLVFHVGTPGKNSRQEAEKRAVDRLREARAQLDDAGYAHIRLCPETMGRMSQFGTLDEILALCDGDARMIPTVDFGHLHAAAQGGLKGPEDFDAVLKRLVGGLGHNRARHFHAHFSRIAYTAKGERRHMTFADADFGPDFAHLAPLLVAYDLAPTIICESRGTQADDAMAMKAIYARAAGGG